MKKLISVILMVTLVLSLAACGGGNNGAGNKEVTSDVELLDFAEERISYLFAPEGFEFDEKSAEGGYNSGRTHELSSSDGEYEINAGLIAGYDSILYDLFLNGKLTKDTYSGMKFETDEVYELPVKEELDFKVAGNKVYYIERTIDGGYLARYAVFEHIDKDGLGGLYGIDLSSNNSDFNTKENSIQFFKDVYGIGRTKSAVYFSGENN